MWIVVAWQRSGATGLESRPYLRSAYAMGRRRREEAAVALGGRERATQGSQEDEEEEHREPDKRGADLPPVLRVTVRVA